MKHFAIPQHASAPGEWVGRSQVDRRPAIAAVLAAAMAIVIQSLWVPIDADVSWLITVCERLLSGDRLYVDVFELNPPASVWLYLPLVWLAEVAGVKPEAAVAAGFVAAGLASVAATVSLASRLDGAPPPVALAAAAAFVALVLPMALFAQREHAALLLAFPVLTAMALIAEGKPLGRPSQYACGIAAGLVIVIKPFFLPVILAPAAWAAWRRRSASPLLPGIAAAVLVIGLYAVAVLLFAAAYFDWLPALTHTYAPMRKAAWKVVLSPSLYPAICLALAIMLRPRRIPPLAAAWALGSAGFVLAAMAQGKNYANHLQPGAALALASAVAVLMLPRIEPRRRTAVAAALAIVALLQMYNWSIRPDPAVAEAVRRVAPPAPTIIALSPQLTTGHPVTRNVGGQWVGSRAGMFIASGALNAGLEDAVARRAYRDDIDTFAADVRRHAPDLVLVDKASKHWLMGEQAVAATMSAYLPVAGTARTEIWLRRGPAR